MIAFRTPAIIVMVSIFMHGVNFNFRINPVRDDARPALRVNQSLEGEAPGPGAVISGGDGSGPRTTEQRCHQPW